MRRAAYWVLLAVTLAIYSAMVLGPLSQIAADAGAPALDMRPRGYSAAEARAFLAALSEDGRAIYAGPQHLLDTIYPALLAITLVWSAVKLAGGRFRWAVWLIAPLSVAAAVSDYAENALIARFLFADPDTIPDEALMRAASFTVVKSGATTIAALGVCGMLGVRMIRKLTGRAE